MDNKLKELPLIALRGLLVYPSVTINLDVGRKKSIKAIEEAMLNNKHIILVSQKDLMVNEPKEEDIFKVGVLAKITNLLKLPNDTVRITIEALDRIKIEEFKEENDLFKATYHKLIDESVEEFEAKALNRQLIDHYKSYIETTQRITEEKLAQVLEIENPHKLIYSIANELSIPIKEKQRLLEIDDVFERNKQLIVLISTEQQVVDLEKEIGKRVQASMEKHKKNSFYVSN